MSIFTDIDPDSTSGTQLATLLNLFRDSLVSGFKATSRPSGLTAGGYWIDNTNEGTPNFYWSYKMYTGSVDIEIFRLNLSTGKPSFASSDSTFEISRISADAVGGILKFTKNRVASSGQVNSGDIIGQLQFVGRANDASNPVVANLKVVAAENETSTASGAYLVWESTITGVNTATEWMRLLDGKLGVGTNAPDSMMHAYGATGVKSEYQADSANGALMTFQKSRSSGTKATQNADVLAEMDFKSMDDTTTKVLSGYMQVVATEAHTTTARGTKLIFARSKVGTTTPASALEIGDSIESKANHKFNAMELVGQNVATAATIAQLSATQILVEMTGSTTTTIQGINSGSTTKLITIHNRSSAVVTISHQNAGAAAADRLKLPSSADISIVVDGTVDLYYCTTDSRWKIKSQAGVGSTSSSVSVDLTLGGTFANPGGNTKVTVITRKYRRALARTGYPSGFVNPTGQAYMWGDNTSGNLGLGDVTARSSPVAVLGGFIFRAIFRGGQSGTTTGSYGLSREGLLYAWGVNNNGQLALGDVVPRSSPVAVLGGLVFTQLAIGYDSNLGTSVLGITSGGAAYAWGYQRNTRPTHGAGDFIPHSSPVAVLGSLKFAKLAINVSSVVGLTTTGQAYSWGGNDVGQLGLGDVVPRSSPVAVLGGLTFADVIGGAGANFYALTSAGVAYAWGNNEASGSLGVGDTTPRSSPVAVLGGLTFASIYASGPAVQDAVIALQADGTAYAWGSNGNGQLGVGNTVPRSSPVAVLGGLKFKKVRVSAVNFSTYGLTLDGLMYAWGANTNGQLGVGDTTPRSSPVAVLGGLTFTDFEVNGPNTTSEVMAISTSGDVYAWGDNSLGQLGIGVAAGARSSPVAVLGIYQPDAEDDVRVHIIPVVSGQNYTVSTTQLQATFGSVVVGKGIDSLVVQYG